MIADFYTQHRERWARRPEHRVRVFLRTRLLDGPGPSVLVGTLQLDTVTGKVTCDPEPGLGAEDKPAIGLLGEVWAWADDAMPQVAGL
ncbi:hypothetical protein LCGC14_1765810 [marine sediment metagenome]|uniref:Uncharacterized protein n=1 Tax=marine sediment metagenome TaxID=412755 RepID=A0A0F9GZR8_9ZZZZ